MGSVVPEQGTKEIQIGPPHMWPEEATLFEELLRRTTSGYLEFGLGGSTLMAIRCGVPNIVAVDSDPRWAAAMRSHPEVTPHIASGRVVVLHAPIGAVAEFGAPASVASIRHWPNYIGIPWAEWERQGTFPDLVFVDGRFRVACCLSVVVAHALLGRGAPGPLIVLHDFQPERPYYDKVLSFLEIVEGKQSLQVMRISKGASPMRAFLSFLDDQFDGR
jgi:hypothetical protein